jgi:hypothetical protein
MSFLKLKKKGKKSFASYLNDWGNTAEPVCLVV